MAEIRGQALRYEEGTTPLVGYLAYSDAVTGRRPGILVVHEWWGLNEYAKQRARQLAELGYVAFALDMYGDGKTTSDAQQARHWSGQLRDTPLMRQRAAAGLAVLANHDRVDPERLAAVGYCFGGTTVLELAYSGANLKGVVSFHGGVPAPVAADVSHIKASLLICHGADDPFVPDQKLDQFKQSLQGSGVDWMLIAYGGAVHSFTNPGADRAGLEGAAYHPVADRRSWQHMKQFFHHLFEGE